MNTETYTIEPDRHNEQEKHPASILTDAFLRNFPKDAARKLESIEPEQAVSLLIVQPPTIRNNLWLEITPSAANRLLTFIPDDIALELLYVLDSGPCAVILGTLDEDKRQHLFSLMDKAMERELRELLNYPLDSAGYMMSTKVLMLNQSTSVRDALKQIKNYPPVMRRRIYTVDNEMILQGQVGIEFLLGTNPSEAIETLSSPVNVFVLAIETKEVVAETLEKNSIDTLPVVDIHRRLLGVIRGQNAINTLKEGISADLQTMVGASRDEQALSSSLFAVRKRQPWLQINLLTGFLAASVVGLFESTIAQFTALAVLMPVAAGQSGNTGAQALAVTMRGLTLREITTRHWLRVMRKEATAGFLNGLAVALTCSLGVYIWSQSVGLSIVIALSMIISMTTAGTAGALVPIVLKKLGQDPAQSSSIVLTTVTDIAGFLSFLGIAFLLAEFLV